MCAHGGDRATILVCGTNKKGLATASFRGNVVSLAWRSLTADAPSLAVRVSKRMDVECTAWGLAHKGCLLPPAAPRWSLAFRVALRDLGDARMGQRAGGCRVWMLGCSLPSHLSLHLLRAQFAEKSLEGLGSMESSCSGFILSLTAFGAKSPGAESGPNSPSSSAPCTATVQSPLLSSNLNTSHLLLR